MPARANLVLLTAGEATLDEVYALYKGRGFNVIELASMLGTEEDAEYASMDVIASWPVMLDLRSPFERDELRGASLDQSLLYRLVVERLTRLLMRVVRCLDRANEDFIVLGREYGLAGVPMKPEQREEMKRMAALTSIVASQANLYQIVFAGGAHLTVKDDRRKDELVHYRRQW